MACGVCRAPLPRIIVHVENVVSLFSSSSTSSQKVRKCGSHKFLSQAIQLVSSSLLDRILSTIASAELPKFAEMLLGNDVAFIAP